MNSIEKKLIRKRRGLSTSYPRMFARVVEDYLYAELPKTALKVAVKGVNGFPDYMPGQWMLAHALAETGRVNDAVMHLTAMLEKVGFDRYGAALLAELYERAGEIDAALRLWAELFQLDPFDAAIEKKLMNEITRQLKNFVPDHADKYIRHLNDGLFLYTVAASLLTGEILEQKLDETIASLNALRKKPENEEKPSPPAPPIRPSVSIFEPKRKLDSITENISVAVFHGEATKPEDMIVPEPPIFDSFEPYIPPIEEIESELKAKIDSDLETMLEFFSESKKEVTGIAEEEHVHETLEDQVWHTADTPVMHDEEHPPSIVDVEPIALRPDDGSPDPFDFRHTSPPISVKPVVSEEIDPFSFSEIVTTAPAPSLANELPEQPNSDIEGTDTKPRKKIRPLVSRTIAELYAQQNDYYRAVEVYRELLRIQPERAEFKSRLAELEALASTQPLSRRQNEEAD